MSEEIFIAHRIKLVMIERKMIFNQKNYDKIKQEKMSEFKKAFKELYTKSGKKRK